jgi:protein-S-isoprenylcysteine O-methyltransferase Ste14
MPAFDDFSWKDTIPSVISTILFLLQMFYGFFIAKNVTILFLEYTGVAAFILSGIFGMAPVIMFPKKGGVGKGKSFVYTTKVVDSGIYAIIRHPQYSSFILWAIAAMLLFQNIVVIVLGLPILVLIYLDMMKEEKRNITKFGESYKQYMKRVPRVNFLLGLYRHFIKKR